MRNNARITRNRLFLAGGILLMLYASWVFWPKPNYKYVPVRVTSGDTVWSICARTAERYKDGRDVREIIYYTKKANSFDTKMLIQPGQVINVQIEVGEK